MTGARVLLVDDHAALLDNLREVLQEAGYAPLLATTARAALDLVPPGGFDVAIVDLRLPDQPGTELAAQLKLRAPESEVVLLTGFATLETAIAAVRAGAFAYLVKPVTMPDLLLTVEQALRQVRLHAEKRELARRAQVAEKLAAVGTMTAGLSHEIRNPLNAAGLQLAVLERGVKRLPADQQRPLLAPLKLVRDEIRRLEHLLEDFLQFARPRELVVRPVALAEVLHAVVSLLTGDAERRRLRLSATADPALPPVAGDPERLRQVFMNLALNALEATPAGGRVEISARRSFDQAEVCVDDEGPGIAPEVRDRLFEPFFTTKASGTGLGLPIVHAFVTQHGGFIDAGKSPLGGARLRVLLPFA